MKFFDIFGEAEFVSAATPLASVCFKDKFKTEYSEKTEITVTSTSYFRVFINGKKVNDDIFVPAVPIKNDRMYAVKYDISECVGGGVNTLCIIAADSSKICYAIRSGDTEKLSGTDTEYCEAGIVYYDKNRGEKHDYTKQKFDGIIPDGEWRKAVAASVETKKFVLQKCPADMVIRTITPELVASFDGYDVYDLKESITGSCAFKSMQSKTVKVEASQKLTENNDIDTEKSQFAEFVCDGEDREYSLLFSWHSFRYFRITKGTLELRADAVHTKAKVRAVFNCENETISWLYEAYIRTQLADMHAGRPTFLPHTSYETAMLTLDTAKFYEKLIDEYDDGDCEIVNIPYAYYKEYGDIRPAQKYFDKMLSYAENVKADGFREKCLYISTLDKISELADAVGEDGESVKNKRKNTAEKLAKEYFDKKTGDFDFGKNAANAYAVLLGLGDERTLANAVKSAGDYPDEIEITAKLLFEKGYFDEAVKLIADLFGYMYESGATTLWDDFKTPKSTSSTKYAKIVKYLFDYLLGYKKEHNKIVISPKMNELTGNITGQIMTDGGMMFVTASRDENTVDVFTPDRIQVEVIFDGEVTVM